MQPDNSLYHDPIWDSESASLIEWYTRRRDSFPLEPFPLGPGRRVVDPELFYKMLDVDIARGPDGPRARRGALQQDLLRLRQLFDTAEPEKPKITKSAMGRQKILGTVAAG